MRNYKFIAKLVLLFVGILTIAAIWKAQELRFDYEFEDYFPKSDTEYAYYNQFRQTFGSDNDFVLISLINHEGAFNAEFLANVDTLSNALKKLAYVETVVSPTQLSYPVNGPFGMSAIKWIHWNEPDRLKDDSLKIFESGELIGSMIATDGKSLNVILNTTYGLSKVKSDLAVKQINEVLDQFVFDEVKVAGRIFGQKYYVEKMVSELVFFTLISFGIIILFLALSFRSLWGVIVPLVIVSISVVWLIATMITLNKSFDLMSTLLPTIMFVVGMSDVVHFVSRYLEELRKNRNKLEAIKVSFTHIGKATLLTSVTTAIGFLTLYTSGINPVRDFGLFTATGVMIAFVVTFLVLPSVLVLLPIPKRIRVGSEELFWNGVMRSIFRINVSKPKWVLGVSILLVAISFIGISRVDVNNFLLQDLSKDDPMRANFEFFDTNYAGSRPLDIVISKTDSLSLLTLADVVVIDSVESVMKTQFETRGFISLNSVIKNLRRANSGGGMAEFKLPENEKEWKKIKKQLLKFNKQGKLKMVLNEKSNSTRISGKVRDFGGMVFREKYIENKIILDSLLEKHNMDLRYTGMAYLIDRNSGTLASSLMWGLLIAFAAVGLLMGMIFKSVKMVLITFIPNIIPLLMVGGFMGYVGIDLKISTSIIFTIAFGIAVDDTIHYVSKLKMELDNGRTLLYALKRASISTGKAIVLTSLILVSGFFALIFSDFASTFYIGLLVSITLLFAVLSDLFLLPVLIFIFYRKN